MKYRQIGNTELTVSEIGVSLRPLATNDYGHVTEQDTVNLLTRAYDMGFTYFDTADSYTEGYGERVLARALDRRRHDIVISTKAGYDFYAPVIDPSERGKSRRWTPGFIQYACEQSLLRLNTDYIDLFLLHHPHPDVIDDDELFGLLDDLVVAGKTRYYGVMLDDTPESEETGEGAIDHRQVSAVEMTYGLLEQEPGRNLIRRAQDTTTSIIAYNPSASGALEEIRGRDDEATNLNERLRQEAFERYRREREAVVAALREFGGDIGTWAIKFALASPTVASTLPIATSYARLLELAEIADRDELPKGVHRAGVRGLRLGDREQAGLERLAGGIISGGVEGEYLGLFLLGLGAAVVVPLDALHLALNQPEVLLWQQVKPVEECQRPVLGLPPSDVVEPGCEQRCVDVVLLIEHDVRPQFYAKGEPLPAVVGNEHLGVVFETLRGDGC